MQAGTYDYDEDGVLPAVSRVVFINGVRVDDSWLLGTTLEAQISSDLPEIVAGVGGRGEPRYGTITIGPRSDVEEVAPTPLNREGIWPPKRGHSVIIEDESGDQRWRRGTGVVVDVDGVIGESKVTISWRDTMDDLIAEVELAPIARQMPGIEQNVNGTLRRYWHRTAIEPWGVVCEALEDAGYRLLPSIPDVGFYALFQGGAHPRIGRIEQTYSAGNLFEWDDESGFQYLSQWSYFGPGYEERQIGDAFTVYLRKTRGGPDAQTRWTMDDGAEMRVTLQNGSVALSRNGVVLAQQGFSSNSPLPWAGLSIRAGEVVLWHEGGTRRVAYDVGMDASSISWNRVRVMGAAALAASYEQRGGWPDITWPSLRFRGGGRGLVYDTQCTRTVDPSGDGNGSTAGKIIGEISAATLTGFWMDEHGVLNWVPSSVLESQAPVETVTEDGHLLSGSWEEVPDGVARRVAVSYDAVALTQASAVSVTVKAAGTSGQTLQAGGSIEEFVGPEPDEEWIEPDMSPLSAGQNSDVSMRRGLFSMWGGSHVSTANQDEDLVSYGWSMGPNNPAGQEYLTLKVDNLTPNRWKVTHSVTANAPQVQLVTLPNSRIIPVPWRGVGLPIWRARGRALFARASVNYRRGPSWAREYTHTLGAWGSKADAQRVGNWLMDRMDEPMMHLNQVQVIPDPRRQIGDVVELNATRTMGGVMRLLTVGIREETGAGTWRQTIDYRVISQTPSDIKTYGKVEDSFSTYAQAEDSASTYAQMED